VPKKNKVIKKNIQLCETCKTKPANNSLVVFSTAIMYEEEGVLCVI
jgi:Rps23 Pro-64 3,4-dihydroxylase Tpa1-like proline 4-hydroxylase